MRLYQLILFRNKKKNRQLIKIEEVFLQLVIVKSVANLLVQLLIDEWHQGLEKAFWKASSLRS